MREAGREGGREGRKGGAAYLGDVFCKNFRQGGEGGREGVREEKLTLAMSLAKKSAKIKMARACPAPARRRSSAFQGLPCRYWTRSWYRGCCKSVRSLV